MDKVPKRSYRSPARKQQAEETKQRIVTAAYEMLSKEGFAGVTVDAVAQTAGVATPTIYAIFGSKTGLLDAVLDQARFGPGYQELVGQAMQTQDPIQKLRFVAAIARQIYDAERSVIDLMGGAGVVSPELAEKMKHRELDRFHAQAHIVAVLDDTKRLKPGLDRESAADILWTLSGRDLYRMLVQDRGWTADKYQAWLEKILIADLTTP